MKQKCGDFVFFETFLFLFFFLKRFYSLVKNKNTRVFSNFTLKKNEEYV